MVNIMLDGLKSLQIMAKLQAELEKLSQNEENKKVLAVINELNEIKNKHDLSLEDFTSIVQTAFPKTKNTTTKIVKMVKVQVGDNVEEWPESKKGALSKKQKALAEKHKVSTYAELIKKIEYIPSAET